MQHIKKALVFETKNGGRLKITLEALKQMLRFKQTGTRKESGGVLIGRYIEHTDDIVIDEVTTPQKSDKRGRFSFFKNKTGHQRIINQRWKKSGGALNYLGEWHTHPEDFPTPSPTDIETWKMQVTKTVFEEDYLIYIIIGRQEVTVFQINKTDKKIQKLNQK